MSTTEAVTSTLMKLALDGAALRHQAIAANIANAATPGYAPVRVSFEATLQDLRARLQAGGTPAHAGTEAAADLSASVEADPEAAAVAIDQQTAALAQNVVQYQALLKGFGKRMAILATAINEGKR